MTPVIEEILHAIRNSPEVREAVRRELLTPELLELPERFAAFAAETNLRLKNLEQGQGELRQGQTELREAVGELRQGQAELREAVGELRQGQAELREAVGELRQGQERLERKHEDLATIVMGIREDIRPLKGAHARNAMKENALEITLPHNCLPKRELTKLDLYRMIRDSNPKDISGNDQESFRNADLIIEAEHEDTGEVHYFAVEASFTSGINDIRRAIRNAGYITRFTGRPAHPVVACVGATPEAEAAFGLRECERYSIPQRHLEPE